MDIRTSRPDGTNAYADISITLHSHQNTRFKRYVTTAQKIKQTFNFSRVYVKTADHINLTSREPVSCVRSISLPTKQRQVKYLGIHYMINLGNLFSLL